MKLTELQNQKIKEYMNPEGHNHKDINWIKPLNKINDGYNIEIGYWVSFLDCSPVYNKTIIWLSVEKLNELNSNTK